METHVARDEQGNVLRRCPWCKDFEPVNTGYTPELFLHTCKKCGNNVNVRPPVRIVEYE